MVDDVAHRMNEALQTERGRPGSPFAADAEVHVINIGLRQLTDPELRRRLTGLTRQMGVSQPEALADQLVLLIDGAYVNGHLLGNKGPADSLLPAALALISAAGVHAG